MSNTPNPHGRILIVDDTVINVQLMSNILHTHGYEVLTAANGRIALETIAAQQKLDLILMDINMPEMDGYETCKHLRAQPRTRMIPIIFISTLDTTEDKLKAFDAGASDYIPRPYQPEEVLMRVRNQLMLRSLQRQLKVANQKLARANHDLAQSNQALSQSNDKLESTYHELVRSNENLTRHNQQLTQRVQELTRNQENQLQQQDKFESQLERRSAALNQLNAFCARLLPDMVPRALGRQKITQLHPGEHAEMPLTLLLLSLREPLPAYNFVQFNEWLAHMYPGITQHAGTVLYNTGSTLLALFPQRADDAAHSALFLQQLTTQSHAFNIGISLHSTTATLGITGCEQHLHPVLDARTTMLLQQLERLGRQHHAGITCSAALRDNLQQKEDFTQRFLGRDTLLADAQAMDFFELLTHVTHTA